jgi:hypothetical protein
MRRSDRRKVIAERQREVRLLAFRVFGGVEYHAMHSTNFNLEPAGVLGSATCWSLEVLPSGLTRLWGSGRSPNFGVVDLQKYFPTPQVLLFRWSPQLQLTWPARIVTGIERSRLYRWGAPIEREGSLYSWTIEQDLLDLDLELVESFLCAPIKARNEVQAKATFADATADWAETQRIKRFLSAGEEAELVARFKSCRDWFPKTVKWLAQIESADDKERPKLMAQALKELQAESLILSALSSELSSLSGDKRRRYWRMVRNLRKRTDHLDRKLADLWTFLRERNCEEMRKFLQGLGLGHGLVAKSFRRRHERLGLFSRVNTGPTPRSDDEPLRAESLARQISLASGFALESFPERYVKRP